MPVAGHVDEISRSRVEGWAVDLDRPEKPVSVSVFVDGVFYGMCLAAQPRPGLILPSGEAAPEQCAFVHVFEPPLSPFVEQRVEVVVSWSGAALPGGRRTLPRPIRRQAEGTRIPIILTSAGRSGTTLLMHQFARHAGIVVGDQYPYEMKQIAYHAAAFRALAAAGDRQRSTNPDLMFSPGRHHWIGANPYHRTGFYRLANPAAMLEDFYESRIPEEYATLYGTLIQEFYEILARSHRKQGAKFLAEKGALEEPARQGGRLFFNQVREIVLVRDPRDLLCSVMAFWKQAPAAAMVIQRIAVARLHQIVRSAGKDTLVVRYEDLIREPAAIRDIMSQFLGLDLSRATAAGHDEIPDTHRTTESPEASIGRWRRELTPEQIEACDITFAAFMRDFDYPTSDGAGAFARPGLVAAEGAFKVHAFIDNTDAATVGGTPSRRVLDLTFGKARPALSWLGTGWSKVAPQYVLTDARESHVGLPPIGQAGDYRLYIFGTPLPRGTTRHVTVLVNGREAGAASLSDACVLEVDLPQSLVGSADGIVLTLRMPDAAGIPDTPGDNAPPAGFSLSRLAIFQATPTPGDAARPLFAKVR